MLAGLGLVVLIGTLRILFSLGTPFTFGNEGWNGYHIAAAMAGHSPYPPPHSLFTNNYPPLSYYLVGAVGRLTGDILLAGRLMSFVGFLGASLAIAAAARMMGANRRAAGFATLLFMAAMLFDYHYVGINDPQMLAHAIQLPGLLLVLRARGRIHRLALAALFLTLGVFVKHSLVALPLACFAWLALREWRSGLWLALFGLVFAGVGAAAFQFVYERSLLPVLDMARVMRLDFALRLLGRVEFLAPIAAALWLVRRRPSDPYLFFTGLYAAIALGIAAYFLGGAGTSGNMLFDFVIALSLLGGLGFARLRAHGRTAQLYAACFALPVAGFIAFNLATGKLTPRYWLDRAAAPVVETTRNIAWLRQTPGPALCQNLALCFRAGKPVEVDLWGLEQAVAVGRRDGHELIDAIKARRYAVLQLDLPPNILGAPRETIGPFTEEAARHIAANYRLDHADATGAYWRRR